MQGGCRSKASWVSPPTQERFQGQGRVDHRCQPGVVVIHAILIALFAAHCHVALEAQCGCVWEHAGRAAQAAE